MISLVEILQKTLLEVFVIFLQPIESHASPSAELHPLPGGLFGYHLRQFIQSLVPANSSVSWSSIDGMIQENVAPLLFLEVWFPWIRTQIEHIQTSCKAAFSRINSPADVSKLQRLVSQSCLSKSLIHEVYQKNVTSTGHFDKAEGKRNESDLEALDAVWSTSCSCLLENILTARWNQFQFQFQPRSLHPSAPNGQVTEGGKLVWIYIFRQPFLSLVERLMKISCRDIFHTVKHSVIGILSSLSSVSHRTTSGSQKVRLLIDTLTFDMKYQTVEKPKASKPVSVGGVSDAWEDEVSCFASSTELFLHAEKVRLYLENQMMTLMNELLFTVRGANTMALTLP